MTDPLYSLEQIAENIQKARGPMEMALWANMLTRALREYRSQQAEDQKRRQAEQEVGRLPTEAEPSDPTPKPQLRPEDVATMAQEALKRVVERGSASPAILQAVSEFRAAMDSVQLRLRQGWAPDNASLVDEFAQLLKGPASSSAAEEQETDDEQDATPDPCEPLGPDAPDEALGFPRDHQEMRLRGLLSPHQLDMVIGWEMQGQTGW